MALRVTELTRQARADRDYLSLDGIREPLQQLLADFAMLSANASTVLQQPSLTLSLLPTLPEDQARLSLHVRTFRDKETLSGGIMAAFRAVITIANMVQNTARELLPTAQRLDRGSADDSTYDDDLASFRSLLNELSSRTTSLNPDSGSPALLVDNARTALNAFVSNQIKDDVENFKTAVKEARYSGNIERLKLQISSLQNQINEKNSDIAQGATSQIGQALAFGFSIGKTVASAETDPGKLVLGVGFEIKGEIDKADAFAKEMQKKNDDLDKLIVQYRDLVEALAEAEQEMSVLLTIAGHCGTYGDNIDEAATSLKKVLGQIQMLHNGIEALTVVDSVDKPGFFSNQINKAIARWKTIADTCDQNLTLARNLGSVDG